MMGAVLMRVVFLYIFLIMANMMISATALALSVFSPDRQTIATASKDHTVVLWESAATRERVVLGQHEATINSLTFSADGRRLLSASDDGTASVWDVGSAELLFTLPMSAAVRDARFAANGQRILTRSSEGKLGLWHANDGTMVDPLDDYVDIVDADISADGSRIVATQADGLVSIWDGYLASHQAPVAMPGVSVSVKDGQTANPDELVVLERWAKSWSAQNLEEYLSYYADGFTPGSGQTREQWQAQRRQRISRPTAISVTISDVQSRRMDETRIEMKFTQHYQSDLYSDTCRKQIIWRTTASETQILSEQSLSCR